jgi:hypothetical protein
MFYMLLYCIVLYNTTSCVLYSMNRFFLKLATYVISGLGYVVGYVTYIGAYLGFLADPLVPTGARIQYFSPLRTTLVSLSLQEFIWPADLPILIDWMGVHASL